MSNTVGDDLDHKDLLYSPNPRGVESDLCGMGLFLTLGRVDAVTRAFLILIPLTINSLAASAADEKGSEYRNWCRQHALADKVAMEAQESYIKACIKRLLDADTNPRKKADDETDNQTGGNN